MKKRSMLAAAIAVCAWLLPAAGQTVYRCGDSYSQQPCPDARAVPAEDARTAAQRTESLRATQRDAQAAHKMEEARLKEEARAARAPADAVPSAVPEEKPVVARRKKPPRPAAQAKVKAKKIKADSKADTDAKGKAPKKI
jgi:hypothetical protein